MPRHKSSFGGVRKLPSGRYQARYTGPDLVRHNAPGTFQTKADAEAWIAKQRVGVATGEWTPTPKRRTERTLGEVAEAWLEGRTSGRITGKDGKPMKPRTRAHYESLLSKQLAPLTPVSLPYLTVELVEEWYDELDPKRPTLRAHAYALLRTICNHAVAKRLIRASPCTVPGAGQSKRASKTEPATLAKLETITTAMPERLRLLVLLGAWCALRFGEATELRRKDIDLTNDRLHVRRGVVRVNGELVVGDPKSDAGKRTVAIPPHLVPMVREHLAEHVGAGREALLFTGSDGDHLAHSSLLWHWHQARHAADRDDLRFHDLRHTGAVLAAQTGATLAELMARLGHSTPSAALRYQHAARDADSRIAQALSKLATGGRED